MGTKDAPRLQKDVSNMVKQLVDNLQLASNHSHKRILAVGVHDGLDIGVGIGGILRADHCAGLGTLDAAATPASGEQRVHIKTI